MHTPTLIAGLYLFPWHSLLSFAPLFLRVEFPELLVPLSAGPPGPNFLLARRNYRLSAPVSSITRAIFAAFGTFLESS